MLKIVPKKNKVINTRCEICRAEKFETIRLFSVAEKKEIDVCRIHGIEIFKFGEKYLLSEYLSWCTIKKPTYS